MAVPYRLIIRYRIVHDPEAPPGLPHVFPFSVQLQVNDRVHCGYGDTEQEAEQQLRQSLMSVKNGPVYIDLLSTLEKS